MIYSLALAINSISKYHLSQTFANLIHKVVLNIEKDNSIKKLLRQGYDLFNMIDKGEAVDASKFEFDIYAVEPSPSYAATVRISRGKKKSDDDEDEQED